MPTYEYQCQKCATVYEERRTFARADEPSHCPACRSSRVRRLLSTFIAFSPGSGLALSGGGGGCACLSWRPGQGSAGGTCACQTASRRA